MNKEKEKYNNAASLYSKELNMVKGLAEGKRCFMCKSKFPEGLLDKFVYDENFKPVKIIPRGDFMFHLKSTHGLPEDFFDLALTA